MGVEAVRVTSADWASMVLIVIVDFCVVVVVVILVFGRFGGVSNEEMGLIMGEEKVVRVEYCIYIKARIIPFFALHSLWHWRSIMHESNAPIMMYGRSKLLLAHN